jgi:hypothetical protein
MEAGGGSKGTRVDPDAISVHKGDGSSSEISLSTASNTTLKDLKTTNAGRKKERKDRRAIKTANREAREKKKEEQRLEDKKKRKEARITRQEKGS